MVKRQQLKRATRNRNLTNQLAVLFTGALTATLFVASIALSYYLKTNPSKLTDFAVKLQANSLTKPIGTYIYNHRNQTIGALPVIGAAFSSPLIYQAPIAIGGLIYTFEIASSSTSYWEYVGFSLSTLLLCRARTTRIRVAIIAILIVLIAYDVLALPGTK